MTVTCSANWIFNFAVGLVFPLMQGVLGPFVFVPFGTICLLASVFTYLYVPETKNKSLERIQREIRDNHFSGLAPLEGGDDSDDSLMASSDDGP
jgi:hypothetical protein